MLTHLMYFAGRTLLQAYATLMLKMDIYHYEELPVGPKIFVCNHPSATDPFMIHVVSREHVNVLITAKAFGVPLFGWFLRTIREIPVPLEQGSLALDHAQQSIGDGRSVVIFIEGQISPQQGGFWPPRTGAARLALRTGAPVIPVGIFLRRELNVCIRSKVSGLPSLGYWYLRGPYAMTIGQKMKFAGRVEDREYVRHVTEAIMREIRLLSRESEYRTRRLRLATSAI
jgi:1-acyl-sn-glycerol-3-phosphate acyltransferase